MFKKLCAVTFAILAITATMASAQCTIAAYGDAAGTQSLLQPKLDPGAGEINFSIFVVLFAEDTANLASYKFTLDNPGADMFFDYRVWGPNGLGLKIDEPTGTNVSLGECVNGFFGAPILIEEYSYQAIEGATGTVQISANLGQNGGVGPAYVTCETVWKACDAGPMLVIDAVIPTEATSFGSIKSLYN